jgi:hypothetical protein
MEESMRTRIFFVIALAAILVLPGTLFAQSAPAKPKPAAISVTISYVENNSGQFDVRDEKGNSVSPTPSEGDELKLGWMILTGKGDAAELQLNHTSTIIKISQNTNFKLDKLRSETGGQDAFSMAFGKVRTVAGKASGKDQYQIKTPSAVCGVRGSDVVVEFQEGAFAKLSTLEGTGWIQNAAGDAIDVAKGFFADALSGTFAAVQIPQDVFDGLLNDMKFVKLSVDDVLAVNQAYQASLLPANNPETPSGTPPETPTAPKKPGFMDDIMAKLREILGLEIGSITIGGSTYSKVIAQPTFALGSLKMSLYLPLIYKTNMFDTADWYHPQGNDEWDFGGLLTGKPLSDPWALAQDFANDLFLKIRYMEWGQQRDPFFFKVGNLNDITIGHGLIMRNFANDADFPAIRRVGVNLGLDFGGVGFEAMMNDAAAPDIFGGRIYLRPVKGFKAALGFTGIVDWSPAKDWPYGVADVGNPIFINPGVDLDLPFVESSFFSLVAFADGAVMIPWFRTEPTGFTGISSGPYLKAVFPSGLSNLTDVKNWGVAAGLFGNLIIKDFTWRLEFRDYTGSFIPQFYNSGYERDRTSMVNEVLAYLENPADPQYSQTLGIFGEGGLTLPKLFSLTLSYFWPWAKDSTTGNFTFGNDHFVAKFTLEKGVIPVVKVSGSVSYERTNFVPALLNKSTNGPALFDANTIVSAIINYPVSEGFDVSLLYTTMASRDPVTGAVIYDPNSLNGLLPKLDTSFSITLTSHL